MRNRSTTNQNDVAFRKSNQRLAPSRPTKELDQAYSLYPAFPVPSETVNYGFDALAGHVASHRAVRIDGFVGVFWDGFREKLEQALSRINIEATWIDVSLAEKSASEIESIVKPFLGGDDPLFGTRYIGELTDFFDASRLDSISIDNNATLTILYGCGSALVEWEGPLIYIDLPKNELQYRSRAGNVLNLGADTCESPKEQYKRFYFVDWPILNRHQSTLIDKVDWFVDGQRPDEPTYVAGAILRDALDRMSTNVFRVRPWFEEIS